MQRRILALLLLLVLGCAERGGRGGRGEREGESGTEGDVTQGQDIVLGGASKEVLRESSYCYVVDAASDERSLRLVGMDSGKNARVLGLDSQSDELLPTNLVGMALSNDWLVILDREGGLQAYSLATGAVVIVDGEPERDALASWDGEISQIQWGDPHRMSIYDDAEALLYGIRSSVVTLDSGFRQSRITLDSSHVYGVGGEYVTEVEVLDRHSGELDPTVELEGFNNRVLALGMGGDMLHLIRPAFDERPAQIARFDPNRGDHHGQVDLMGFSGEPAAMLCGPVVGLEDSE